MEAIDPWGSGLADHLAALPRHREAVVAGVRRDWATLPVEAVFEGEQLGRFVQRMLPAGWLGPGVGAW